MKTYQPKLKEIKRETHEFDANGQILGRLATQAAVLLMGKHKPTYSTHLDSGDFVVINNASKIEVTGKKATQKLYRRHSGYPSGFKEERYEEAMVKHPTRILELAIAGMLPDNKLKAKRMKRLTINK
jgi:large subunit ribosomal protein L13